MNRRHHPRPYSSSYQRNGGRGPVSAAEPLEPRRLLCGLPIPHDVPDEAPQYSGPDATGGPQTGGIVWVNRTTTDNFEATYGAEAAKARLVVDAAIAYWNRVITNFNQDGGNDQVDLTVTAMARGTGQGGSGGVDTLIGNKPRTSSISLGGGSDVNGNGVVEDAEGFYIDPTPDDYREFQGNIVNAFTGDATPGSDAASGRDLFSLVTIEIQHALGVDERYTNLAWRQDPNDYIRPAGSSHAFAANDTADTPGKLYLFNGPGLQALFTSNNGGAGGQDRGYAVHTARPGQIYVDGGVTYRGQTDTGTTGYPPGRRYLPSYVGVQALGLMYGYSVNPPQDVNGTFYAVADPGTSRIFVRNPGSVSDDRMEVRSAGNGIFITLDIGNDVLGTNMDGPFVCQFSRTFYSSVDVNGDIGNDILRADGTNGLSVTLRGGNGDDALDISFVQRNLDLITSNVTVDGGIGNDTLYVYDDLNTRNDTFSITASSIGRVGSAGGVSFNNSVEGAIVWAGSGVNTTNVTSFNSGQSLFLNNVGGNDTVNVGAAGSGLTGIQGYVQIENNPAFTTLNINDTGSSIPRNATIDQGANNFGILAGLCPGTIAWDNADIQQITVTTGNQTDALAVLRCSERLFIKSAGGFDNYTVGNSVSGLTQITAAVDIGPSVNIGVVPDSITIDDRGSATGRSYGINPLGGGEFGIAGTPFTLRATDPLFFFFKGGNGNDTMTLNGFSRYVDFDGGGGFDNLLVDDRTNPNAFVQATLTPTAIDRTTGGIIPVGVQTRHNNLETISFTQRSTCTTTYIHGTPSTIAPSNQVSVFTTAAADTVVIYPVDANGNLTINGNIGISDGGGSDTVTISAVGTTRPVAYAFSNPFGSGTQNVFGLGSAALGTAGFESITVDAGDGDDTFAVNQFSSGAALRLRGGGGDDACTLGTGDISATLTSASFFEFNGQNDSDRFTIANGVTNTPWTYQANTGSVISTKPSTGYAWTSNLQNIESQYVFAGSAADTFIIDSTAQGVYTEFNGFGGIDELRAGTANLAVNSIRGPISYNAGADGGTLVVSNAGGFVATAHQDANSIGAYAGDNLFGAGGSLTFSGVTNNGTTPGIAIVLRSNSTLYAQPLTNARVSTSTGLIFEPPSGSLRLATAGLTNPVINGTAESGSLTSTNRQTLSWFNYAGAIQTDAVAPAVIAANINVNGIPGFADGGGNRQAIEVQFSETVSGRLNPSWLQLQNTTTGQAIPTSAIAVDYVAGTNTARFTFPGLANGVLPDGNYSGKILAGLPDFFGNALPADVPFAFFFLNGDANRDRTVGIADFAILASNFNSAGAFVDGDFNYSGTVEIADFAILAARFNAALEPASTPSSTQRAIGSSVFSTRPIEPERLVQLI